jgi:bacillithiol system protein YtxJ
MAIEVLSSLDQYEQIKQEAGEKKVFILKHSLICPVSFIALEEFQKFSDNNPEADCYLLKIQEIRELSNYIAQDTGVRHESPQALMLSDGKAVWSKNHYGVSEAKLQEAYKLE